MIKDLSGFQWDDGNWPKCGKHGVGRAAIEHVVSNADFVVDDPSPTEKRFRTIGQCQSGRYVFVVFTVRQMDTSAFARPISARYMHRQEIEAYENAMASFDE